MGWLDARVPMPDPNHRGTLRWALDFSGDYELSVDEWRMIVASAVRGNMCGVSLLDRVVLRVGPAFNANVRRARLAEQSCASLYASYAPFRLGACMTLRPTTLASVRSQVSAFAEMTTAIGVDRREFAAIEIHDTWDPADYLAVVIGDAVDAVTRKLRTRPYVLTTQDAWIEHRLSVGTRDADLWACQHKTTNRKPMDFNKLDGAFNRYVAAWQFDTGKSVIR